MAAVRCLARRLGKTLATVAEERRGQLVPRRFFSEHAHEMKQKMRKQKVEELYDALYKRGKIPTTSPSVQASQEPDRVLGVMQ
uniref:Uncharacterized protein n=1 Tax=Aegilops tauschii subsp. strangulata TaxID=200361 RepID=A0A452ZTS0_AEGTS